MLFVQQLPGYNAELLNFTPQQKSENQLALTFTGQKSSSLFFILFYFVKLPSAFFWLISEFHHPGLNNYRAKNAKLLM